MSLSGVERAKYERIWTHQDYRKVSPGANVVLDAIAAMEWTLPGWIADIGCGTGRASQFFADAGFNVIAIDTALNAMDQGVSSNPLIDFRQLCLFTDDLRATFHPMSPHGFCCDVMEHIPKQHVEAVVANIATACRDVFFGIAHFDDTWHGDALHLTVERPVWWKIILKAHFANVEQLTIENGRPFKTSYWRCGHG